jgi:hypothetical protein
MIPSQPNPFWKTLDFVDYIFLKISILEIVNSIFNLMEQFFLKNKKVFLGFVSHSCFRSLGETNTQLLAFKI